MASFKGPQQRHKVLRPYSKVLRPYALDYLEYPRGIEEKETGSLQALPALPPARVSELSLSTEAIDRWPTQVDLSMYSAASLLQLEVDAPHIDEQPTLKIAVPEVAIVGREGYIALLRALVKSSGLYALASLSSPLVSLVLAPLLTHALSRSDYGALTVMTTTIALLAGITQLGLTNAFFRAYTWDYESQSDRLRVVSTTIVLLVLISLPVALGIMLNAAWLSNALFGSPAYSYPIKLSAWVILFQNLSVPGFAWLRAEGKALYFALLSIFNLLLGLGGTILLVGRLHMGISGSLIATGGGYAVVAACSLPLALARAGVRPRLEIAWNLLSFGIPLVANFVSVWVLQLSDRYLLAHLGSLAQTASYSVAYTLGGLCGVAILSPFSLAWPSVMFTIAKREDASTVFRLVFRWFSLVLLLATFGLSLVGIAALELFFPPAYHAAAAIIPLVAASVMFYGIFNIFLTGVSIQRKTWYVVIFTTLAALLNVGCNLVLIPLYGSMGAALSTLLAYAVLAVIAYGANQRIYPLPFEVGLFTVALLLGVALYLGSSMLAQGEGRYVAWALSLGAFGLYAGFLALLVRWPAHKRGVMQGGGS